MNNIRTDNTGKKIMVVEDEAIVARDIGTRLTDLGYKIAGVYSTAEDAIGEIQERCPDLILMDIKLKGEMDGIDAGEKIYSTYSIPIVYLTAFNDQNLLRRTGKSKPYGYILKPFDPENLRITIEIALYKYEFERKLVDETENAIATILGCVELMMEDKSEKRGYTNSMLEKIRNSAEILRDKIQKF